MKITSTSEKRFGKAALDQLYRGIRREGRPLLFLDFDDVICLSKPYGGYDVFAPEHPADLWEKLWHQPAVAVLRDVLKTYDPQVVLSTSWLRMMEREGFEQVFARTQLHDLSAALHPQWEAPPQRGDTRCQAIERWLAARYEGQRLVVFDDAYSGTGLKGSRLDKAGCVVLCDVGVGLHEGLMPQVHKAMSF